MVSYTIFFGYRYWIGTRRRRIILNQNLVAQIETAEGLNDTARQATLYILNSIIRSKELFNYAFICVLSIFALLLDLLIG